MPRSLGRTLLASVLLLQSPVVPAGTVELPSIGDPSGQVISPREEQALGQYFMYQLRQTRKFVEDPEIAAYLDNLGHRLAAASDSPSRQFTFFMIEDPTINAFAGPGGYIGTHTGLFLAARSEAELAGVLAHEIAHVTQRHLNRAYEAADRFSLPTMAALLAAVLIGTQSGEAGQAAIASVQAASIQRQINFTRANEKEADRIGMSTLVRSGFDPLGMPHFFERLERQSRFYGDRIPTFLRTHPVTEDRIADALARVDQLKAGGRSDSLTFRLMQAKLRVITADDAKGLIRPFREAIETGQADVATRYGYALALTRVGKLDDAHRILQALAKNDPDRITYQIALGQVELAQGRNAAALKRYEQALALYPANPTLSIYYAQALLQNDRAAEARKVMETLIRTRGPNEDAYRLLGEAATALGRKADAHEAMAEFYLLRGQTRSAIRQLELALAQPDLDFVQTSRLESRLHDLKSRTMAEDAQQSAGKKEDRERH